MIPQNPDKNLDVLCVGIAVMDVMAKPVDDVPAWDHLGTFDHLENHIGGCAVNTAVDLARLGLRTGVSVCVGADGAGQFIKNTLATSGLDTRGVVETGGVASSFTFVMIGSDGRRRYLHHVGANAAFTETDIPDRLLGRTRFLHVGGSFLMPGMDGEPTACLLKRAKDLGLTTSLDTAYNPRVKAQALIEPCLKYLDVFLPSVEEAELITRKTDPEAMLDCFSAAAIPVLGIKLGAQGCIVRSQGKTYRQAAFQVRPVDTSGAGDAFMAGFIYGLIQGWETPRTARFANAVAAHCIQAVGCSTGIRPAEEILKFMEQQGEN
jgi:sugar/nucleoside kinase (ribokinase family)